MFCENCGTPVKKTVQPQGSYCQSCGKELPAAARFCDNCGTPTGVEPRMSSPREPSLVGTLLREFFRQPAATMKLAADKERA